MSKFSIVVPPFFFEGGACLPAGRDDKSESLGSLIEGLRALMNVPLNILLLNIE